MPELTDVGRQFDRVQRKLKLTDTEMAAKMGVSWRTLYRWKHTRAKIHRAFVNLLKDIERHGMVVLVGLVIVCGSADASVQQGFATYYTAASCRQEGTGGVWTASGQRYDEAAMTCALPFRPFGGSYRVCTQEHPSRCVVVRHNDFGPGKGPRSQDVVVDLTPAAYDALGCARGINRRGVAWGRCLVTVERIT